MPPQMLFLSPSRPWRGLPQRHLPAPPGADLTPAVRPLSASWPLWKALEVREMGNMILLQLFILAVILVSFGQLYLIGRYLLWPRIRRVTHCPWCWRDAGIERDFPAPWSSTICSYHSRQIRAQASARHHLIRHLPPTPATKPAAVVLQAEEVQV